MMTALPLPEKSNLPPLKVVEKLCRSFSLAEILSATNNFDDSLIIGRGGFGEVYKGVIDNGAKVVAIKRLSSTSKQGESEFRTEIEMLSKFRHSHIVSLIGYCYSSVEMIIVYEYMSNGSLADHLYKIGKNGSGCTLSWVQRLKICLGAARGLDYLHTGTGVEEGVIHRDVKSSNILLDESWAARVSDFGLSKTKPINQSHASTNAKGTRGYMDPEYMLTRKLRMKSDVYSFGVVLLEVLCRRRPVDLTLVEEQRILLEWVTRCIEEERLHQIVDPNLRSEIFPNSLTKFVEIANQCLCYHSKKRPTMTQVVASLELALALQLLGNKDSSILEMEIFEDRKQVDSTIVQEEAIKFGNCVKPTKRNAFKKTLQLLCLCMAREASGIKLEKVKRSSQQFDANKEEMESRDNKFEKVDRIFRHFDTNGDDCLNTEEVRAFAIATNPRVKFTDERINGLVIEFFQIYSSFTDGKKGLTFMGFLQMYDDDIGDVNRDFATLWPLNSRLQEEEVGGGSTRESVQNLNLDALCCENSHLQPRLEHVMVRPSKILSALGPCPPGFVFPQNVSY